MNNDLENLREMILGVRQAYQRGENAMEYARTQFGQAGNSPTITLLAYDLQAGNYVAGARANPGYREQWCGQIARLLDTCLADADTVLEVGCGEATTLAGTLQALKARPSAAFGFDISWSRCAVGTQWLSEKGVSADLFVSDLFNIPLADNSIDVIYTAHSLEPNGGRETQAIAELMRVARKAVVLVEPAYEFASPEAQARMRSHGYVRDLRGSAEALGLSVVSHRLLEVYGNPLNPSGVLVLQKPASNEAVAGQAPRWRCPVTFSPLEASAGGYFAPEAGLLYPVVKGIPLLRPEHAVVASAFASTPGGQ